MSEKSFGIDLGTSTSIISYIQDGRPVAIADPISKTPIVPSIVGLTRRDQLVIGQAALDEALPGQTIREAKRSVGSNEVFQLGEHRLSAIEISSLILRKMKQVADSTLGVDLQEAVITVPAYFDDIPRRATEQAAIAAGIKPLRLISEPVAAALSYGIDRLNQEGILLVFDFGGGTLDVTILEMFSGVLEVKTTDGDKELGGKDIDEAIISHVANKVGFPVPEKRSASWEPVKVAVERAKKALSSAVSHDIYLPSIESGNSINDWDTTISTEELDQVVEPIIEKALNKIDSALKKGGISKGQITNLLLVGGTCWMPSVRKAVQDYIGLEAESGVDPDMAVSLGAAISAGLKMGDIDSESSVVLQDASTYRLGTSAVSEVGSQYMLMFSELMPANSPIPFVRTQRYHMMRLDQDEVNIDVLQDRSGEAVFAEQAIATGASGVIKDIPPSTTDEPRAVDIELRFDESQIIRVTGKVVGIDKSVTIQLNSDVTHANPLDTMNTDTSIEVLWESSPLATRNSSIIKRAERLISEGHEKAEMIEARLSSLKNSIAENNPDSTQEAREQLTSLLADI